jgi:hypothetical protein
VASSQQKAAEGRSQCRCAGFDIPSAFRSVFLRGTRFSSSSYRNRSILSQKYFAVLLPVIGSRSSRSLRFAPLSKPAAGGQHIGFC